MKKEFLAAIIVFFSIFYNTSGQTREPQFYLGAFGNYNINIHNTDFTQIPQSDYPYPTTKDARGNGFSVGALFETKLSNLINLNIQLGFLSMKADFVSDTSYGTISLKNKQPPNALEQKDAIGERQLNSVLFKGYIEPAVSFNLFGGFDIMAGTRIGYLVTSRFNQREGLKSPSGYSFADGRDFKYESLDLEIPDKNNIQAELISGIKYDLNIGGNVCIVPQVRLYLPLTTITKNTWDIYSIEAGIALKLPIYGHTPVLKDTMYYRDTTDVFVVGAKSESIILTDRKEKLQLEDEDDYKKYWTVITESYTKKIPKPVYISSSLETIGVHKDGTREKDPAIIIEDIEYVRETVPLLPYIFFKEGNAYLNETDEHIITKEEVSSFHDDSLKPKTLVVYTELINIVGFRLTNKFPGAKLTVVGCNNNTGIEKENIKLSEDRANAVKDYLVNVWDVESDRIEVKTQNLPSHPASIKVEDGQRENQRIEFYTDVQEVLAPIMIKSFTHNTKIPTVEIYPKVKADIGTNKWSIEVVQMGKVLRSFTGAGEPQNMYKWEILDEPIPEYDENVTTTLRANDTLNQTTESQTNCKILHKRIKLLGEDIKGGTLVEKFYIIAHFNAPDLLSNQGQFMNHIKSRIRANSKVTISGFCDRTGSPAYNKRLAVKRVNDVQKALQVMESNLKRNPVGSDVLLYDNDLPQGRCYSRTIQVTVSTYIE